MTKAESREFGKRLREVRTECSLSLKQLAGRSGVSLSALGRYERGRLLPGLDIALALSAALDVSIDYLATGKGPKRRLSPFTARVEEILAAIESLPRELREALAALFLPAPSLSGEKR